MGCGASSVLNAIDHPEHALKQAGKAVGKAAEKHVEKEIKKGAKKSGVKGVKKAIKLGRSGLEDSSSDESSGESEHADQADHSDAASHHTEHDSLHDEEPADHEISSPGDEPVQEEAPAIESPSCTFCFSACLYVAFQFLILSIRRRMSCGVFNNSIVSRN